jgi:hypothetical protein
MATIVSTTRRGHRGAELTGLADVRWWLATETVRPALPDGFTDRSGRAVVDPVSLGGVAL